MNLRVVTLVISLIIVWLPTPSLIGREDFESFVLAVPLNHNPASDKVINEFAVIIAAH